MALTKAQILAALMKYKCFKSKSDFAKFLDITPQRINGWFKDGFIDLPIVAAKFPEVSQRFLMTGEGEMLNTKAATENYLKGLTMTRSERIKAAIQHMKIEGRISNYSDMCKLMDFGDAAYIGTLVNKDDSEQLPAAFITGLCKIAPEVNMNWILTGVGDMLSDSPITTASPAVGEAKYAVMIPEEISASPNFAISDFLDSEKAATRIVEPSTLMPNMEAMFTVSSSNMSPALCPGDIAMLQLVNTYSNVDEGIYVVDSKIFPKMPFYISFNAGVLTCKSIAEGIRDILIPSEQLRAVYRVVGMFRRDVSQRLAHENTLLDIIKADRINFNCLMQQNVELSAQVTKLLNLLNERKSE